MIEVRPPPKPIPADWAATLMQARLTVDALEAYLADATTHDGHITPNRMRAHLRNIRACTTKLTRLLASHHRREDLVDSAYTNLLVVLVNTRREMQEYKVGGLDP
jgi:hypothetical protein